MFYILVKLSDTLLMGSLAAHASEFGFLMFYSLVNLIFSVQGGSNPPGTDHIVSKIKTVPLIFETSCIYRIFCRICLMGFIM